METQCEGYYEKLPPLVEMLSLSVVANTYNYIIISQL